VVCRYPPKRTPEDADGTGEPQVAGAFTSPLPSEVEAKVAHKGRTAGFWRPAWAHVDNPPPRSEHLQEVNGTKID